MMLFTRALCVALIVATTVSASASVSSASSSSSVLDLDAPSLFGDDDAAASFEYVETLKHTKAKALGKKNDKAVPHASMALMPTKHVLKAKLRRTPKAHELEAAALLKHGELFLAMRQLQQCTAAHLRDGVVATCAATLRRLWAETGRVELSACAGAVVTPAAGADADAKHRAVAALLTDVCKKHGAAKRLAYVGEYVLKKGTVTTRFRVLAHKVTALKGAVHMNPIAAVHTAEMRRLAEGIMSAAASNKWMKVERQYRQCLALPGHIPPALSKTAAFAAQAHGDFGEYVKRMQLCAVPGVDVIDKETEGECAHAVALFAKSFGQLCVHGAPESTVSSAAFDPRAKHAAAFLTARLAKRDNVCAWAPVGEYTVTDTHQRVEKVPVVAGQRKIVNEKVVMPQRFY